MRTLLLRPPPRFPWRGAVVVVTSCLAAAVVIAATVLRLNGVEWFVVLTPSMGRAAPVGTIVFTEPVAVARLHVGDIISFRPDAQTASIYTHRVVAVDPAAATVTTRGDINAALDPWPVADGDLIGRVWLLVPAAGWVLRMLPPVVVGLIGVWVLTALVRAPLWRRALRGFGFSAVLSTVLSVFRPFVGVDTISSEATPDGLLARVVSTGLMPVSIPGLHDDAHLRAGVVRQVVLVPETGPEGQPVYALPIHLDLSVPQWGLLLVICLIPFFVSVIDGVRTPPAAAR